MPALPPDLSFDDWVLHVFDHPATEPEWHWAPDAPYWPGPPAAIVAHLTRLFENPLPPLEGFTDAELNKGFWYIASNGLSDYMFALADQTVPLDARLRCVRALSVLYRQLFATRCTPHLSHLDEPGAGELNAACYMWWDICPLYRVPDDPAHREIDRTVLDVMSEALAVDAIACQESALHGLGHWHHVYPREVETIVDRFIAARPTMRPELLSYARSARGGCVL
jgi:hypothetical protein